MPPGSCLFINMDFYNDACIAFSLCFRTEFSISGIRAARADTVEGPERSAEAHQ
jgi:hypothetical protein